MKLIDENISEYYDNQMSLSKRINSQSKSESDALTKFWDWAKANPLQKDSAKTNETATNKHLVIFFIITSRPQAYYFL